MFDTMTWALLIHALRGTTIIAEIGLPRLSLIYAEDG